MERAYLLERLKITKPGLSGSDLIPVMAHYWFGGKRLMTYNDQIGISVPCSTPFKGAVPGGLLWAMISGLSESKKLPLEMAVEGENLTIKYRKSNIKFAVLPEDTFVFKFPAPDPKAVLQVDMKKLLPAIEICMKSANDDTTAPEMMGLTVIGKKGELLLFASDNATMMHSKVPIKGTAPERAILNLQFCQQLLALAKDDAHAQLELHDDYAMLTFNKDSYLFGRLIQTPKQIAFEDTFARHYNSKVKMIPVPKRLQEVLALSVNITDGPSQDVFSQMKEVSRAGTSKTQVSVSEGMIYFSSESPRGKYTDNIKLAKDVSHPDCKAIYLDPKRVRDGCSLFEEIAITSSAVIMTGKGSIYLVGCSTKPSED